MPGVKRKAQPSRQAEGTSKAAPSSSSRAASSNSRTQRTSDSEDGQFDDDQDLLAQAMTGNGADESDGSDDGSGHSNLDEPMADAELAERVEGDMQSDEDMEGGFEDLEGADAESAGFEGLEGEEDDNPQEDEPMGGDGGWAGRKKSQSALYAIPSYEEVQGLKETGDLFKSNVFKLQVSAKPLD